MRIIDPYFSIIIPTYNRAHCILETLESVRSQEFVNWECIIVDDGSTDNTLELCRQFGKNDSRFIIQSRPAYLKQGGNDARNFGVSMASAAFLVFIDSDDLVLNTFLQKRYDLSIEYPGTDLYIFKTGVFYKRVGDSNLLWNDYTSESTNTELIIRFFEQDMPWHTMGAVWKKRFFLKIGGWDGRSLVYQDWELHLNALFQNPKIKFDFGKPDSFYRINEVDAITKDTNTIFFYKSALLEVRLMYVKHQKEIKENSDLHKSFERLVLRHAVLKPLDFFDLKTAGINFFKSWIPLSKSEQLDWMLKAMWCKSYKLRSLTPGWYAAVKNLKFSRTTHLKLNYQN